MKHLIKNNVLAKNNLDRNVGIAPWSVRRRIIALTLIFCASVVAYITFKGIDTRTAETIVQSAFYLSGAVIGSYVFAASWQDKTAINNLNFTDGPIVNTGPTVNNMQPQNNISNGTVDNPDKK